MTTFRVVCDHVSKNHVHCNRCKVIDIGVDETPTEAIQKTDWTIDGTEFYCPEHS
jgi:hypothetical protein